MWLMLARASPRNPYVAIEERSSNFCSLDVVKRSHRMGRSSFCRAVSQTLARLSRLSNVKDATILAAGRGAERGQ